MEFSHYLSLIHIWPEVKAFLEFALGDEGQSIASQIGLVPLSK